MKMELPHTYLGFCFSVLGGWKNTKSTIRLCKECNGAMSPLATPDLLSPYEYRQFYISFSDEQTSVGLVGQEPFMALQHNTSFGVKHIGINSGHGSTADWISVDMVGNC